MKEKITKYKKYIIGIVVVVMISTLFLGINNLMKNKNNGAIPEVKLREINKTKTFAIMIQNGDIYEEYTSEDNTWPGNNYKFKEAKCINNNGDIVEEAVTFANGKATLKTNKTVYCTLYFDEKEIIEILREKDTQKYLSTAKPGEMYRYQAAPKDANEAAQMTNWICFGTSENCGTNDDLIDKYMYRIIGITENGQLYLLKETFVKDGSSSGFVWDLKNRIYDCLGEICEWPNVDLYKRLNKISNGTNPGGRGDTNIFLGTNEHPSSYEYLTEGTKWYNLIDDHNWIYGDTNESENGSNVYNGEYMYRIETGKVATKRYWPDEKTQTTCSSSSPCTAKDYTWSKIINAKIGLMYIHDVDYAYPGGNPENYTNLINSWIYFQKDGYNTTDRWEWLISRFGINKTTDTLVCTRYVRNGTMGMLDFNNAIGVRPVFYLESYAKIKSGSGTKTNPYVLDVQE